MKIVIGWANPNKTSDAINVYRSEEPFAIDSLPPVFKTLPGDASRFEDSDIVFEKTYYYRFEIVKGTDKALSSQIQATANTYSGPGPQNLIAGDLDCGLYGTLESYEFVTFENLFAWANIPSATLENAQTNRKWMKFSHKGKTLFTPQRPVARNALWNNVYGAGLVYGVDGPGPREINTRPEVNQMRILEVAGSRFIVRLPTALPPGFDLTSDFSQNTPRLILGNSGGPNFTTSDSYDTVYDLTGSEWNDLFYKVVNWTPPSQVGNNFADYTSDITTASGSQVGFGFSQGSTLFQEMVRNGVFVTRGRVDGSIINDIAYIGATAELSANNNCYWRPILELIP